MKRIGDYPKISDPRVREERQKARLRRYGKARDHALRALADRHPQEYRTLYENEIDRIHADDGPLPGDNP